MRDAPDRADVQRALDGVLASEMFRGSPKLGAFLRYVVEATLRGEQDRIKGYTIGVEALGREEDFDPQIDPIVRVEATRLRRTLDRYYAGPGANDRIVFALSRGSYVPAISLRAGAADTVPPVAESPASAGFINNLNRRTVLVVLAGALVVIAGLVALTVYRSRPDAVAGRDATPNGSPPRCSPATACRRSRSRASAFSLCRRCPARCVRNSAPHGRSPRNCVPRWPASTR